MSVAGGYLVSVTVISWLNKRVVFPRAHAGPDVALPFCVVKTHANISRHVHRRIPGFHSVDKASG